LSPIAQTDLMGAQYATPWMRRHRTATDITQQRLKAVLIDGIELHVDAKVLGDGVPITGWKPTVRPRANAKPCPVAGASAPAVAATCSARRAWRGSAVSLAPPAPGRPLPSGDSVRREMRMVPGVRSMRVLRSLDKLFGHELTRGRGLTNCDEAVTHREVWGNSVSFKRRLNR
jgi:hypothetical protein